MTEEKKKPITSLELAMKMGAGLYSGPLATAMNRWGISEPRDQARFLAQVGVESQGYTRLEENLRYTHASVLFDVFGNRNGLTLEKATELCKAGPEAIANFVYGGDWGKKNLGNIGPTDGWDCRGSGLIMITGLDNFKDMSIKSGNPEVVTNKDCVRKDPNVSADLAACFWYNHKLNGIEDIEVLTGKINQAHEALDRRIAETNRAYSYLG